MADTLRQDNFAQDTFNQDSFNSGGGTAFVAPKGFWRQHWWRGKTFAAGWFTGVGVDAVPIGCVQAMDCDRYSLAIFDMAMAEIDTYHMSATVLDVYDLPRC